MNAMINVGFNNLVASDKVISIMDPNSAPTRRQISRLKEQERVINATAGRAAKSAVFLRDGFVVLSALATSTLGQRMTDATATPPPK